MIFLKTGIFNTSSGWIHTDNFNKRIDTDGWWWPASTAAARATFKKKTLKKSVRAFSISIIIIWILTSLPSLSLFEMKTSENAWKYGEKKNWRWGSAAHFCRFWCTTKVLWIHRRAGSPNRPTSTMMMRRTRKPKNKNFPKWCWRAHTHVCAYLRYPRLFAVWTFKRA